MFILQDESGVNLRKFLLFLVSLYYPTPEVCAQKNWSFEYLLGDAYIFPTTLTVKQNGFNDISLTPEYRTESFEQPFYYSLKLTKWKKGSSLED